MRVFIKDVIVGINIYGNYFYDIIGQLESGLEIFIGNNYYDLERDIGTRIEMLLSFLRSPYSEVKLGIEQNLFRPFKYYSIELLEEVKENLKKKGGYQPSPHNTTVVLTGEYIEPYTIPAHWVSRITRNYYKSIYKEPSAIKTEHGTFLLNPIHLKKKIPLKQFPSQITINFVIT